MNDDERIAYLSGDSRSADGHDALGATLSPAERAELDSLRDALSDAAVWVDPGPALEDRIVSAIVDEASRPSLDAVETDPVESDPVESDPVVVPIARARSRRIRYAVIGVAAAVVFAIAIAIGVTVAKSGGSKPMEFAASMRATALAPGASGEATLTQTPSGWRVRLNAQGLPRLDNGRYYQAWLKDAAGVLVTIGTFNAGADVTLWAGVPPSSYPTLTVTRQVVGAGSGSSGEVVLAGIAHRVH